MGFLDHIDPGNSGGSVRIPDTPFEREHIPIVYTCSICSMVFKYQEALDDHRIAKHPIRRPMLLIDGRPLRDDNITIRTEIQSSSITVNDVDSIYLNDKKVTNLKDFLDALCNTNPAILHLKLVNQNYPVYYRWAIDIAKSEELADVDSLFYNTYCSGLSTFQAFGLFNERANGFSSGAKNYAAGLACYVASIITKDQLPGATLPFEKYRSKLGESMDILHSYRGRALPDAIFAICDFMYNDFQSRSSDRALPQLDLAKRFFNSGLFQQSYSERVKAWSIPTDTVTDCIIEFCSVAPEARLVLLPGLLAVKESTSIDASDRAKVLFVLWGYYNFIGKYEEVRKLRNKLIHNPHFSSLVAAIEEV